jgi:epoxyqueuosine reductase
MNRVSFRLARLLEDEGGFPSLQIPANEPLRIHDGVPKGMVSLKHIGQFAGIGSIAMNSLLVHPEHGNLLRLGGVITQAPLPPDTPMTEDPCPDGCEICKKVCPVSAIQDRSVNIKSCMKLSLRHPLLQPYIFSKFLFYLSTRSKAVHRIVEDIANMLVSQYSESCTKCLVACRHFQTATKRKKETARA